MDRLSSMGEAFRELPRRLMDDDILSSLRLCDAGDDDVRERAFDIFGEVLRSSQERELHELHERLAAKESETARLGRQLGAIVAEQRDAKAGVKGELAAATVRLRELEDFHSAASERHATLEKRAVTLEEETIHWRDRCLPLRDRCAALETEVAAYHTERAAERATVELATRMAREAEDEVRTARSVAQAAEESARQVNEQRANDNSEARWLRQGLSIMLSQIFEVVPMDG